MGTDQELPIYDFSGLVKFFIAQNWELIAASFWPVFKSWFGIWQLVESNIINKDRCDRVVFFFFDASGVKIEEFPNFPKRWNISVIVLGKCLLHAKTPWSWTRMHYIFSEGCKIEPRRQLAKRIKIKKRIGNETGEPANDHWRASVLKMDSISSS